MSAYLTQARFKGKTTVGLGSDNNRKKKNNGKIAGTRDIDHKYPLHPPLLCTLCSGTETCYAQALDLSDTQIPRNHPRRSTRRAMKPVWNEIRGKKYPGEWEFHVTLKGPPKPTSRTRLNPFVGSHPPPRVSDPYPESPPSKVLSGHRLSIQNGDTLVPMGPVPLPSHLLIWKSKGAATPTWTSSFPIARTVG